VSRLRSAAGIASVALAAGALFAVSKGKWSDALIDSGREWIVPDALSRGGLLYKDVVYWFGPFTPYYQAAFLRAFGSGFPALVAAGAVTAAAVLAVLYVLLRRVTDARSARAWTALAVPALVFMPNAGGALLGMGYRIWHAAAFALAAVAFASSGGSRRRGLALLVAGACAGLSGLCRTEWGLAAAAGAALAALVRTNRRTAGARNALVVAAASAAVFAAGLGPFLRVAGVRAVLSDGHVLLTGLPPETRHFLVAFSGLPDWRSGLLELLYSTATWLGAASLVAWLAWPAATRRPRALGAAIAVCLVVLVATAAAGGAGGAVIFSASPLVCLAALGAGLRRRRGSPAAALAASGALGLVLSYRRPFHIGDSAYVGPPLLFALVGAAGLLHLFVASQRRRAVRGRLSAGFRGAAAALVVAAFAARFWQYGTIEASPIAGTSGMLSAREPLGREIEELAKTVREHTRDGDGLAVFPEGELLNLLSGRPNPIRHKLYLPGYLTAANEADVLRELQASPPAAVVFWRRPVTEYDRALFGEDYGAAIRAWIEAHYDLRPFRAVGSPSRAYPRFTVGWRR
jgi:hypothetical protein